MTVSYICKITNISKTSLYRRLSEKTDWGKTISSGECIALVSSKDGKINYDTSASTLLDIGKNTRKERAQKKAMKKCEKSGGQNCLVETDVCDDGS